MIRLFSFSECYTSLSRFSFVLLSFGEGDSKSVLFFLGGGWERRDFNYISSVARSHGPSML